MAAVFVAGCVIIPGAAASAQTPRSTPPVRVVLTSISPKAPGPHSKVRIAGRLVNTSGHPLRGIAVRARSSSSAFVSRGELQEYSEGDIDLTRPLYDTAHPVTGPLAPGESAGWTITVRPGSVGLRSFGVYPLGIEALSGDQRLGLLRTFLPFVPASGRPKPTRIAWLWPIVDQPHRAVGDTFIDGGLSKAFGSDGRLSRLVEAGSMSPVPLMWTVDPALLQAARAMTAPHTRATEDGSKARGPSSAASQWLHDMRHATQGDTVVSLPYADPDIMALHRAGLDRNLTFAITKGPHISESILDQAVAPDVVWPPDGWLSQDALDNLAIAGVRTVVVRDQAFPPARRLTFTPGAVAKAPSVGGTVKVLLADHVLTDILGRDTSRPGAAALTEQRYLAETALITAERPNRSRTLLVAPPRRWRPGSGLPFALLSDTAKAPWLDPVALDKLETTEAAPVSHTGFFYPNSARRQALPQRYLAHVRAIDRKLDRFTSILTPRSPTFDFAVLRTESSAWRDHPKQGVRLRREVARTLDKRRGDVRILTHGPLRLASSQGTVPITLANDLSDRTVTVGLKVIPRNRARLDIGEYRSPLRIGPEHKVTVKVPITASASGVAHVTLRLTTPQGEPYGRPTEVDVRATGYGDTALIITGGAAAVLFLAVGVRLVRRALAGGRGPTDNKTDEHRRKDEREHAGGG